MAPKIGSRNWFDAKCHIDPVVDARENDEARYDAWRSLISDITGQACRHSNTDGQLNRHWDRLTDEDVDRLAAGYNLLFQGG